MGANLSRGHSATDFLKKATGLIRAIAPWRRGAIAV
jgi:hypothetical protein